MKVWQEGGQLKETLRKDPEVMTHLRPDEIEKLFDLQYHLKHIDEIFENVFPKD